MPTLTLIATSNALKTLANAIRGKREWDIRIEKEKCKIIPAGDIRIYIENWSKYIDI